MDEFNNWYVEFKLSGEYEVPFSPCKPPFQSEKKLLGRNIWGPFHCSECAHICASFGKTEKQAYDFNHGTADEQFGVFLSGD
jgi:hypothetical protein